MGALLATSLALHGCGGGDAADLVINDFGFTKSVSATDQSAWMLLQDPGKPGTFLPPQRLPLDPHDPYDVAIGDLSGDGVPVIVLADSLNGQSGARC